MRAPRSVGLVTVVLLVATAARASASPAPSPERRVGYQYMKAVNALSPTDAWVVGFAVLRPFHDREVRIQHWNGSRWARVPNHAVGEANELAAVDAVTGDDVWAVGSFQKSLGGDNDPLALHWDGIAWSAVNPPRVSVSAMLYDVSAAAADDVWAVGGDDGALIEHWDGTVWHTRKGPESVGPLRSVSALAPKDVWSVSDRKVLHWDGTSWMVVEEAPHGYLTAVTALSDQDVWAVGLGIALHWDGSTWAELDIGTKSPADLHDVAGIAGRDVWGVGVRQVKDITHPLADHWNGTRWSVRRTPQVGDESALISVDPVSHDDVWAVGYSAPVHTPFTLHWDGAAWTEIPLR